MAGKKRKTKKSPPTQPRREPTILPDRRAMEAGVRQLLGGMGSRVAKPNSPAAQAQTLLDRAFQETDPRLRRSLAQDAAIVDPDCADAYVLLAESANNRREVLEYYEKGVAAAERTLGPEIFQRDVGHFWGLLETRPYMRARQGLANCLWTAGRRDEAIAHLEEMLRLNPNDNQGIRYALAGYYLKEDRDDDLARLLQQFDDDGMAAWAYNRALLAFRKEGDSEHAQTAESRGEIEPARR